MEQRTEETLSPYRTFSRAEWAALRDDTPMTLTSEEVTRLRSLHDRLDLKEVEDIYLPLSRLLSLYVAATQRLFRAQERFLGTEDVKMPFIIGVAGSVAVGKSTTARVLQALLARWPNVPKVDLITTDGFLYPNAILEREVLAPPDIERIFGLTGGSIFQGEQGLDQMAFMRPSPLLSRYATPVHGLYLCGAGTHPGGGVMGASGHNAAHAVLRQLQ